MSLTPSTTANWIIGVTLTVLVLGFAVVHTAAIKQKALDLQVQLLTCQGCQAQAVSASLVSYYCPDREPADRLGTVAVP